MRIKYFRARIVGLMALFLSVSAGTVSVAFAGTKTFAWYDGKQPIGYHLQTEVASVVNVALGLFSDDMTAVTGQKPVAVSAKSATIRLVQLDRCQAQERLSLKKAGAPVDELANKPDGFYLAVVKAGKGYQWLIVGSNGRGTAYGLLELSRLAGVSPWVWWSDVHPRRQSQLTVSTSFTSFQSPSVAYRGIFLNDEDWSLQPWSWKTFEPNETMGRIGPKTYGEIFKLLLRLRANAIWPGMHGITTPFYCVPGAKEMADSCGIVIGTSHCEPLMRSNVGEWKTQQRGDYNYMTNRDAVQAYWVERLKEVNQYDNLYTIGMRGIHDGPMEGVKTMNEQTVALQQVLDDQRALLSRYVNPDVTKVKQVFVPYKEVLDIMENGLVVPDDVTLMWCDDNYGYMTRLSDAGQQRRSGGAGIYYHLSYWGRPHDYMWLTTTQPGLIYNEMRQAYNTNARRVWIVNVHDLKPAAYDLELFLDLAWDIQSVSANSLNDHLKAWLVREFGDKVGKAVFPAMVEFYRLCGLRKPEHLGWTQVELDRNRYYRGRSQVIDTEFSLTEFGGELDRYLADYAAIKKVVLEAESALGSDRKDAYYSQIKYPVLAAAAMAEKMLEAQRARSLAMGQCDESLWTREDALRTAVAKSQQAYRDIQSLTDFYNNEMAGGKWKHSMCYNPRDLNVFNPPLLPMALTDQEVVRVMKTVKPTIDYPQAKAVGEDYVACQAFQYTESSEPVETIQLLGHSMNAVSLPKGASLTYRFDSPMEGQALFRIALIPTQPNDKGDIRVRLELDGQSLGDFSYREKGRTTTWKENVLRGQALVKAETLVGKGAHTLRVTALDHHVVVDQWMLDFQPKRAFYVFPLTVKNGK
ncbi:MAG: hypothetical protein GXY09_04675 [Bacteroidales bacterium]|nr:hypothetical protein [Bacteroidales bacterium]